MGEERERERERDLFNVGIITLLFRERDQFNVGIIEREREREREIYSMWALLPCSSPTTTYSYHGLYMDRFHHDTMLLNNTVIIAGVIFESFAFHPVMFIIGCILVGINSGNTAN